MKKSYVKLFAAATALILAMSCFSGCGKKANDKDEQGRTVITVSNWASSNPLELERMNARKARFEEANPDVSVIPDEWTFDNKSFYAKAAGGQLPTVYYARFTEMPEIINSEYSADLSKGLKDRGYDGMFNKSVLEILSDDEGRVKAFPANCYVLGLSCNIDLFEKAGLMEADGTPKQPKDWYEVAEFAAKIKEATGKAGLVLNTNNNAGGWTFTNIAWSFGVDFMEKDENGKWQATFATPECTEALQWYKDLKWKYDVLPANNLITVDEGIKALATGNAAMYITPGDTANKVAKFGMNKDHFGMMALPAGPKRHVTLLGGGVWCLKPEATDDQIDAGLRWLETAITYKLTEDFKTSENDFIESNHEGGLPVGVTGMSLWSDKSEAYQWQRQNMAEKANINTNHVRLYNEFVADCPAEIQPEEPVCCQELYAILDGCIQEVLTNKDADCAEVLKKAEADFQANYLNNLTY